MACSAEVVVDADRAVLDAAAVAAGSAVPARAAGPAHHGGRPAVLALVNDRGPFVTGRVLDLSRAVAAEPGTVHAGVAHVCAEVVRLG